MMWKYFGMTGTHACAFYIPRVRPVDMCASRIDRRPHVAAGGGRAAPENKPAAGPRVAHAAVTPGWTFFASSRAAHCAFFYFFLLKVTIRPYDAKTDRAVNIRL